MNDIVGVSIDGIIEFHMGGNGNNVTLCGIDGGLSSNDYNQHLVDTPVAQKINCHQCKFIYRIAKMYTAEQFNE